MLLLALEDKLYFVRRQHDSNHMLDVAFGVCSVLAKLICNLYGINHMQIYYAARLEHFQRETITERKDC